MKEKQSFISRYFRGGLWQKFLLVGVLEMIGHFILRYLAEDYTSYKIIHFIVWTLFSVFCLIKVINSNKYKL